MPNPIKPSRMLLRLEAEIASATHPVEVDCKRAERAAYLARLGRFDEARGVLDTLQLKYKSQPNAKISCWIHLVDGLICHFSGMSISARQKILRTHALSVAAELTYLPALSAAWLASMDYLAANPQSMVFYANKAINLSNDSNHSVRSRVRLVIAQAYHLAGRFDLALPNYEETRTHALSEGDDLTISALIHNMAWLKAQYFRINNFKSNEISRDGGQILLSAESVANFDLLIGSTSLQSLVPVLQAQILTAQGQYEKAASIFEKNTASALSQGMSRLEADLIADRAWCRFHLGQTESALEDALYAESSIDPTGHFDDRAMAHNRLSQVFTALGKVEQARKHEDLAASAWAGHTALQRKILELLEKHEL
jgi:tetratricopeptide (TPR) repeat protein